MSEGGCKHCHQPLYTIGSFFACQNTSCDRFAWQVNAEGQTPAEQSADALANREQRIRLFNMALESENMGQETVAMDNDATGVKVAA